MDKGEVNGSESDEETARQWRSDRIRETRTERETERDEDVGEKGEDRPQGKRQEARGGGTKGTKGESNPKRGEKYQNPISHSLASLRS